MPESFFIKNFLNSHSSQLLNHCLIEAVLCNHLQIIIDSVLCGFINIFAHENMRQISQVFFNPPLCAELVYHRGKCQARQSCRQQSRTHPVSSICLSRSASHTAERQCLCPWKVRSGNIVQTESNTTMVKTVRVFGPISWCKHSMYLEHVTNSQCIWNMVQTVRVFGTWYKYSMYLEPW